MITLSRAHPANSRKMAVSKYHVTEDQMASEMQVIEAAKTNPERFEPLYRKYYEQIFRYVYQRMDDRELAFDVTSQVFLKALTNIKKYEFRGVPFSSWLYRIALSETNKAFREKNASRTVNIETVQLKGMMTEMDEDEPDQEALREALLEAVNDLREGDLQLVEMRFFEKRPFKEIAEILEITENNAKVRTYRILEKLKKALAA